MTALLVTGAGGPAALSAIKAFRADGVMTVRDQLGRILTDHEARITALEQYRLS
jgi:hypothetical protein